MPAPGAHAVSQWGLVGQQAMACMQMLLLCCSLL